MKMTLVFGIIYVCILNLAGFLSMGIDKKRARQGVWRISERTLFLIAILGGSLGSILGMQVFRHKTRHRKFVIGMPVILVIQAVLCGIWLSQMRITETRRTEFAMGTVITEVIYGPDGEGAAEGVYQCIQDLETQELSWRTDTSAVAEWNRSLEQGEAVILTEQEQQWLQDSLAICQKSQGALDLSIHPILALWDIEGEQPVVPAEEAIETVLTDVGYERLSLSEDGVLTGADTSCSVDMGAVGKGIAGDIVLDYLKTRQVTGAIISIGGTIVVYGEKPGAEDWSVGIQDPRGPRDSMLGVLTIKEGVVSTSGDYEKYFIEQGRRYHHIFDPSTGYPADSGLIAVTVVSENGLISDGLSTACFVLGYEEGLTLMKEYGAEGIFVTTDHKVYVTEGLQDTFMVTNPNYELQRKADENNGKE